MNEGHHAMFCPKFSEIENVMNDFRKLINVIVIIFSGVVATLGYQIIPFKAYVIVAALSGLLIAFIITKFMVKKND